MSDQLRRPHIGVGSWAAAKGPTGTVAVEAEKIRTIKANCEYQVHIDLILLHPPQTAAVHVAKNYSVQFGKSQILRPASSKVAADRG